MFKYFGWPQSRVNFNFIKALLLLSIIIPEITYTQQPNEAELPYEWFDNLIGVTNSGVFEGEAYYDIYNVSNDRHQFFRSPRFQNGSVTYKGQRYLNLDLRYDIFNENLIVWNKEVYQVPPVIFDKAFLSKFSIGNTEFINFQNPIADGDSGFFEIILKTSSFSLFKKNTKRLFVKTEDDILYHEFKDNNNYYLQKDETFFKLNTLKEFYSVFPEHKKLIKELAAKYKTVRKTDFDSYLISILTELEKVLSTTNKTLR